MKTQPIKTHWKKLHNPDYLGSWDFQPKEEKVLTIKSVSTENVPDQNGKKEQCSVCRFTDTNVKPMILNVTNSKAITKVADSPYIEDWQGVSIQLFVTPVKAFGDIIDAVRVRPVKPTRTCELIKDSDAFKKAQAYLKSGGTIDQIKSKYTLSNEVERLLKLSQDA